jgi:hypothetical protein
MTHEAICAAVDHALVALLLMPHHGRSEGVRAHRDGYQRPPRGKDRQVEDRGDDYLLGVGRGGGFNGDSRLLRTVCQHCRDDRAWQRRDESLPYAAWLTGKDAREFHRCSNSASTSWP